MNKMPINPTIVFRVLLALAALNLAVFFYYLAIMPSDSWFVAIFPDYINEMLLFYSPIFFTASAMGIFGYGFFKFRRLDWSAFAITTVGYLPVAIWIVFSIHRPWK